MAYPGMENFCHRPRHQSRATSVAKHLKKLKKSLISIIESSKLACDTGGHCTNYPTWPLPRTSPNVDVTKYFVVDVLNNSLNYYALADLMLYWSDRAGRTSTSDELRSGRPSDATTTEIIKKFYV